MDRLLLVLILLDVKWVFVYVMGSNILDVLLKGLLCQKDVVVV